VGKRRKEQGRSGAIDDSLDCERYSRLRGRLRVFVNVARHVWRVAVRMDGNTRLRKDNATH
jgi:hypothetical protein